MNQKTPYSHCTKLFFILLTTVIPKLSPNLDFISLQNAFAEQQNEQSGVIPFLSDISTDTTEIKLKEKPDSLTSKVFLHYSLWKSKTFACNSILSIAKTKNYTAPQNTIELHLSSYKKAFPGVLIDNASVEKEIIIYNYLNQEVGVVASQQDMEKEYDEYLKNTPLKTPPSFYNIMPILSTKALVSMDTISNLCNSLLEKNRNEIEAKLTAKMQPWSYQKIAVNADSQLCIAVNPEDNQCLVSVGEFNNYLLLNDFERSIPLDTARVIALKKYLITIYNSKLAKKTGLSENKELVKNQEQTDEIKRIGRKIPFTHKMTVDDTLNKRIYRKYYDRFFKEKIVKNVQLIGSMDSIYIDSLCSNLQKKEMDRPSKPSRRNKSYIDSLPWITVSSNDLPQALLSYVDTLKLMQWKGAFKTPYGNFVCRIINIDREKEISFQDARIKLLYLIETERIRSQGKPDSVLAYEYYRKFSSRYITPDTLIARTWLIPKSDNNDFGEIDDTLQKKIIHSDTTTFRSEIVKSCDLPDDVSQELFKRNKLIKDRNQIIGPVISSLGTWYFKIQKTIPGGKKIPFEMVRDKIRKEEIEIQYMPYDSILKNNENAATMKTQIALAGAYNQYASDLLEKEVKEVPDKEILKLIENKTIRISHANGNQPDSIMLNIAREIIIDKKKEQEVNKLNNWINSVIVDRRILFTGID